MRRVPDNYFEPRTERFVVTRTWASGLTKYGYSQVSVDEAVADSKVPADLLPEDFGEGVVTAYERTEETAKFGTFTEYGRRVPRIWQVYRVISL